MVSCLFLRKPSVKFLCFPFCIRVLHNLFSSSFSTTAEEEVVRKGDCLDAADASLNYLFINSAGFSLKKAVCCPFCLDFVKPYREC